MLKAKFARYFSIATLMLLLLTVIEPDDLFARRGSFGGGSRSRSSFGRSASRSSRSSSRRSSFGGTRTMTARSARAKYGTPRRVQSVKSTNAGGRNYMLNDYGGYSSSLMRGYVMGSVTSSMMWMPWYGAFWYTHPVYVNNPDGTVGVYPPTFNWTRLFFVLIVVGGIVYVVTGSRRRKSDDSSTSSFD